MRPWPPPTRSRRTTPPTSAHWWCSSSAPSCSSLAGRTLRDRDPDDRLGKGLAIVILAATLPLQILYFTPAHWSLERTLPVQLCDVASMVAAYALWTHRRWAVALTYYWGFTLTTQAIITPDLSTPFPEPLFFLYWVMHLMNVWAAVHLTFGRRFWPGWHSYRTAMIGTSIWMAVRGGPQLASSTPTTAT